MNERTLDERIATMVERVVRDEREIGVLSTGEQIAVATVLDRRDLLPALYDDWASAAERLGDEWRVACGRVSAAREATTKQSDCGGIMNDTVEIRAILFRAYRELEKQARAYHEDCGHDSPSAAAQCDAICAAWKKVVEAKGGDRG